MSTDLVDVFYLQMLAPGSLPLPAPRPDLTVEHVQHPSVEEYRSLYNAVGEDYNWRSRRKLTDEELAAIIQHPLNELHVLHAGGKPAGFAELDRRKPAEIEFVQFGLCPQYIGQGLGKWFLQTVVAQAWNYHPDRIWLHTCSLDHPAALPNYLRAGFQVYRQEKTPRYV